MDLLALAASKKYTNQTLEGAGGLQGTPGKDGKSAYEIAKSNGFEGTEAEWVASLKGEKGDVGETGPKGDPGPSTVMTGATTSAAGTSGAVPAPAKGNINRVLLADGTWAMPGLYKANGTTIAAGETVDITSKISGNGGIWIINAGGPGGCAIYFVESTMGGVKYKELAKLPYVDSDLSNGGMLDFTLTSGSTPSIVVFTNNSTQPMTFNQYSFG